MGIFDFLRKRPQTDVSENPVEEVDLGMPEVDAESLSDLLIAEDETKKQDKALPSEKYDVGEVTSDDLLSEEDETNHSELDVVESIEIETSDEHLLNAKIIGDLPEQIA